MVNAPLVMPEVIIGLSLLLMLVSVQRVLGFPERGMLTIWLGHLLLGMAYATVVVQAPAGSEPQLEEAAMDLGAKPHQVFSPRHAADDRAVDAVGLAAHLHAVARRRRALRLPCPAPARRPCRW